MPCNMENVRSSREQFGRSPASTPARERTDIDARGTLRLSGRQSKIVEAGAIRLRRTCCAQFQLSLAIILIAQQNSLCGNNRRTAGLT